MRQARSSNIPLAVGGATALRRPRLGLSLASALLAGVLLLGCGGRSADEHLADGRASLEKGDRPAALVHFKAALQADPAHQAARMALAELLIATGDFEAAIVELTRVANEAPQTPGAIATLARVLSTSTDPKRALHRLAELRPATDGDRATILAHTAAVWGVLGDEVKAADHLKRALEVEPGNVWAQLYTTRRELLAAQFGPAEQRIDKVLAAHPDVPEARFLKGELRLIQGDEPGAIGAWKALLERSPGYAAAHEALINRHLVKNELPAARQQQAQLMKHAPGHPVIALIEARLLIAENKLPEARERLLRLLTLAPDHVSLLTLAGAVEARVGSPVQAMAHLRKAVAQSPELESARTELARLELRMGQASAALKTLQPLLAAERPDPRVLVMASDAHLRLGNAAETDNLLRLAAAASPDDGQLQATRLLRRMQRGDTGATAELEQLASRSTDTHADEALIIARLARLEFDAALQAVDAFEKKTPGQASAAEIRARIHFARRQFPEARAAYEEALKRDPARFSAVQALGLIDQLEAKPEQAVRRLEAAVAADPKNALALVTLAEFGARANMPAERVMALLADAVAADPTWADPRRRQIELAIKQRRFKDALDFSSAALAALPEDASLLEAAGRAQFLAGDVEQSVKTLRSRIAAFPTQAAPHLDLARVFAAQGRFDAAEGSLKRAVELEPFNETVQLAYIEQLMSSKKAAEAEAHVRRLRDLRPRDPLGHVLLATVQARAGREEAAIATLREGLARTDRPELALRLHGVYLRLRRNADADALARTWLAKAPNDMGFLAQVATHDMIRGEFVSAEKRLRTVVDALPSNASALNNLAWVVARNGGPDALEFARRAMALAPDDPGVMDTLAKTLSAKGDHREAMALQRRALEADPSNDLLKLGLARVALAAGERALAREHLEALQRLGTSFGSHEEVKELLAKL